MGHTAPDYNRVHWRHGGLTPPALVLVCGRLPAKQRFLRCTNDIDQSGGRQPAVVREPGAVRSKSRSVRRRPTTRPRAAGVSPPWFGEPGAVRLQPRYVGRRPERQPRAAGVSPPWVSISLVQSCSFATAGLRQPLLVARRWFAAKCVIRNAESHTRPRAAGVSPPCRRSVLANRKGIAATVSALATRLRKGTHARW
jgi:hypothetical protein